MARFALVLLFAASATFACSSAEGSPRTSATLIGLAECPVTIPTEPYVGRDPYLPEPPSYYKTAWHGSDSLWTMLSLDGERWDGLPLNSGGHSQKTWWWSRNFDIDRERQPAITVTGHRLDSPGEFTAGPATHAWADFGAAMLVGIEIPTTGCWQIRAEYEGAELAYIALVE